MGTAKLAIGCACLALVACKVEIQPSCSAQGTVDIDANERSDQTPEEAPAAEAEAGNAEAGAEAPTVEPPPPPPPVTCPGPRHSGNTECFPGDCPVGQFCDDPLGHCTPGCVSDANCGPRDACIREPGNPIGRCESCGKHEAADPEPGCVDTSRSGVTKCFPRCGPGTYCVNNPLPECVPGCVSDDNCFGTETCVRAAGEAVGLCRSCFF